MARTTKNFDGTNYIADEDFDYTTAIKEAAAHGDYDYAGSLERSRNAKIDGEGLSYAKTYNYQNGTPATYQSKYGSKIDKTLSNIMNRKPFSYDYTKDDSYKALEKVYTQNGKYAMQDTLGDAAALTGGKASTAAVSASQQAYNRYMSELSANIPALEQAAYGRYKDEEASLYNQLGVYQKMDDIDYGRWNDAWNRDYQLQRDALADERYEDEKKYSRGRDALADERYEDEISYERDNDTIERLMSIAAQTGDYSIIRDNPELADKYGFTEEVVTALNEAHAKGVSDKEVEKAFAKAQYMAQYGDFSYFKEAGFTDEQIAKMEAYWNDGKLREDALFAAQFGDYSKLSELGITPQFDVQSPSYNAPVQNPASVVQVPTKTGGDIPGEDPEKDAPDGGEDPEKDAPEGGEDYVGEEASINIPGMFGGGSAAVDLAGNDNKWYGDDINDTFDFDAYNNRDDAAEEKAVAAAVSGKTGGKKLDYGQDVPDEYKTNVKSKGLKTQDGVDAYNAAYRYRATGSIAEAETAAKDFIINHWGSNDAKIIAKEFGIELD